MSDDDSCSLETILERVCELQKSYVSLQEQLKKVQVDAECEFGQRALAVIDVLDLIEMTQANQSFELEANASIVINKIRKRLLALLSKWGVQEIQFKEGRVEPGKARVLETEKVVDDRVAGSILKICRKGYACGERVIRPADVVTVEK